MKKETLKDKRIEQIGFPEEEEMDNYQYNEEDVKQCFKKILKKMERIKNKHFEDLGKKVPKRDYEFNIGAYCAISYFMRLIQDEVGFEDLE
ncbi:MAG TPA: hypothetical protein ENG87_02130 [Candidatus Pacearchaeota archaeon]|nr:hypothetical protein [Candidatus Pacearchaeota archaeon]